MIRRARIILASLTAVSLAPAMVGDGGIAYAGGHIGTAMTDFTQVTPANAVFYSVFQSTNPDQPRNLKALGKAIASAFDAKSIVNQALGSSGGAGSQNLIIAEQLIGGLGKIFNGEFGMSLMPPSLSRLSDGSPKVNLHFTLDAGLQPGVGAAQVSAPLGLLGLSASSPLSYRHLPVLRLDLRSLLRSAGSGTVPANSPISGILYGTVAGNDAVLASDLPTLKHAIDTWFGLAPSIASNYDFQTTVGALPVNRFLTAYWHLDTEQLRPLIRAAGMGNTLRGFPTAPGMISEASSVAAEPDGILINASPFVRVGSLATGAGLTATVAGETALLPSSTLVYAALNDPGALIHRAMVAAGPALSGSGAGVPRDPIKAVNNALGINLDKDVFSWMHGDASISLVPGGSKDFGQNGVTDQLSLVVTLAEPNQALVEAKLQKIKDAIEHKAAGAGAVLTFVDAPSAAGNPLHMLLLTPSGIGYTFYHGYLIAATALPADFALIEKASRGASLAGSPLYSAASRHFGSHAFGTVFFANLTKIRTTFEGIAKSMGVDLGTYRSDARPVLSTLKSVSVVTYAGPNAGGAAFIGIGK